MQALKISLITVAFNAGDTIARCLDSVAGQVFGNLEFIVIDGGSSDNTMEVITKYRQFITVLVSEPDLGIYDAMNKGLALATGDLIGVLNADDFFADDRVLNDVAAAFADHSISILYGDLDFIDQQGGIVRRWRSQKYRPGLLKRGWMPAHPTFYCRKDLFVQFGGYRLEYGSAADYELMLRFIRHREAEVFYLGRVMVKMAIGGVSNKNIWNRLKAFVNDLKAMRDNQISFPYVRVLFKPLQKIGQFFR